MDYRKFRFRAAVDWLELEVRTLNPHPAWRVWKDCAGSFSYVTGLDPTTGEDIKPSGRQGKNTPTTRFAIRIQNPERFAVVVAALAGIHDLDPHFTITVRSIEIAFDAYAKNKQDIARDQLAKMATMMLRGINRPADSNDAPRFYNWRGTPEHRYGTKSVESAIAHGKTAMFGNRDDNFIVRSYIKDYDTFFNGKSKPERKELLDHQDHRARVEVRLQKPMCPVKTLDELSSFPFESIAKYFKFREPDGDLSGLTALIVDKLGSIGSGLDHTGQLVELHARQGRARRTAPNTTASPLNETARDQLRNLSDRWKKSGRGRIIMRQIPDENSGAKR